MYRIAGKFGGVRECRRVEGSGGECREVYGIVGEFLGVGECKGV